MNFVLVLCFIVHSCVLYSLRVENMQPIEQTALFILDEFMTYSLSW